MIVSGTHDTSLVLLSILVAVFASFTALRLSARVRASERAARNVWIIGAAAALGGGIWSMHFVAMLAFSMQGMPVTYDFGLTLVSLFLAVALTAAGLAIASSGSRSISRMVVAGLLTGIGVVAMHYVGMAAMRVDAAISYDWRWFTVSVLVAICAAIAALWLASRDQKIIRQIAAAVAMGFAIAGMHYSGMRAAVFTTRSHAVEAGVGPGIGQGKLAILLTAATILILVLALGAARLERAFQSYARREARIRLRLQVADILRGRDTAQGLQEIAALMGSHFRVSRAGYGQLDPIEDIFDYDVCWTDGSVPPLLGRFPAANFGVKIVEQLKQGKTVVVQDLLEAELSNEPTTRATAKSVDTRSILVVPFVRDGRLRTIVYLNDRVPRGWLKDEIQFIEELAERTRLVIERDLVENELRELNASLEARVQARTDELRDAQQALLQSQKMEAVGQLVAGLAHDFNNLLGAVVGSLDIVRRSADNPERVRKFAEAGLQAAERGSNLTRQLLAFSRSQRLQLEPLIVCDIIERLGGFLRQTLGPLIDLKFDLNPSPVPVLSDPTQVEMMLLNLAINARDAMPNGGTITISTTTCSISGDAELQDGDYVVVAVADTGTGMNPEIVRRAMDPFFTTKEVGKGTGLGLAQVYGSAKQAGGTVRIESAVGKGTTVKVLLRRTDTLPSAATTGDQLVERPTIRSILIVDDDTDLRNVFANSLEALGYEVGEAADGFAALDYLSSNAPDAVVLDFAMPKMSGAELASIILTRWPQLAVVLATGYADAEAIRAVEQQGVLTLRKPFRIDELLQAISAAVTLKAGGPSSLAAE